MVNKVFKGYNREFYDTWALTATINEDTEAHLPPSRQLCASWVIDAWDNVPEELCAKAWTRCGYKTKKELAADKETALIPSTKEKVMKLVESKCGEDLLMTFNDDGVAGADPTFPEDEEYFLSLKIVSKCCKTTHGNETYFLRQ